MSLILMYQNNWVKASFVIEPPHSPLHANKHCDFPKKKKCVCNNTNIWEKAVLCKYEFSVFLNQMMAEYQKLRIAEMYRMSSLLGTGTCIFSVMESTFSAQSYTCMFSFILNAYLWGKNHETKRKHLVKKVFVTSLIEIAETQA